MTAIAANSNIMSQQSESVHSHQQYGVLPWRIGRQGDLRILLITDRDRHGWGVPKGTPAEGRVPFMSAALDAYEEAGIIGDIDPRPLTDYSYLRLEDNGTQLRCNVTLFAMRVRGTLLHWREQSERERRWFAVADAADRLANVELATFVRQLTYHPQALTDSAGRLAVPGGRGTGRETGGSVS